MYTTNLKALVIVLALAWTAFVLVRPMCLRFTKPETFDRRRKVWFALTAVAFLSPSFGLYALFAIGLLYWATKRDANPLALYVLVAFVVPNASFYIPTVVIGQLFDLTQYRILSFAIVIPWILREWPQWTAAGRKPLEGTDVAILAFIILMTATNMPYESFTGSMRRAFLLIIDWFVVLYAFSRLQTKEQLNDVLAAFFLSSFIMTMVGILEWSKGWLLYTGLQEIWGDPNRFAWLLRGERIRTQAAAQGPLNLGYHIAVALGLYLHLRVVGERRRWVGAVVTVLLCWGLYSTGSRGPWLTAMIAALVYLATRPRAARRLGSVLVGGAVTLAVMYFTPLRETVIDRLPIIGTADQDTIEYRRQLADLAWQMIGDHPLFGDPTAASRMESLRQGQGIIDIVNGYLFTLLFTGWTGMLLFGFVLLSALWTGLRATKRVRLSDPLLASASGSLTACFAASLFFIATAGYGVTTFILAGTLLSLTAILQQRDVRAGTGVSPRVRVESLSSKSSLET